MTPEASIQLFDQSGALIDTVLVTQPGGRLPLVVNYHGRFYVKQDGRYVGSDVASAQAMPVRPEMPPL